MTISARTSCALFLALFCFIPMIGQAEEVLGTSTLGTTTLASSTLEEPLSLRDLIEDEIPTTTSALQFEKKDLTKPEETPEKTEIKSLFDARPAHTLGFFNFFAYWVQTAIESGVPANTIVLILMVPILATLVAFVRIVLGLPSLEMLVPIILAFAFVAVGVVTGIMILAAVVLASLVSRLSLRRAPIMFFPKRSISLLFLSIFVLAALTIANTLEIGRIAEVSIFPILILTLLGDNIVSVQLHKSLVETATITLVTITLGLLGYALATLVGVRDAILLYPELVLLTIPLNIMMGRYFGLRLTEVFRFRTFRVYGSK